MNMDNMYAATSVTVERLWTKMSRGQRVRALRNIAELPQRPGSEESLLKTARRQACEDETRSFLPGLIYSPDYVCEYEWLANEGRHAESTFAWFWLATHRADFYDIWLGVWGYLYPHMQFGDDPDGYSRACFSLLRAVRDARA